MSGYTADFALVCEGITDHAVLKNILLGLFKDQPRPPRFTTRQPDADATGEDSWQQFGNWENVFRYLREGLHQDALQFNNYLIVQVDTDDSEHVNFGVPQQEGGKLLEPADMAMRVAEKLREIIGSEDCATYEDRIIFAICVRSIECWLLPLWETGAKAAKSTGCLRTLNTALARKKQPTIAIANKESSVYNNASAEYRKREILLEEGSKNPSLKIFLEDMCARAISLPPLD